MSANIHTEGPWIIVDIFLVLSYVILFYIVLSDKDRNYISRAVSAALNNSSIKPN